MMRPTGRAKQNSRLCKKPEQRLSKRDVGEKKRLKRQQRRSELGKLLNVLKQ